MTRLSVLFGDDADILQETNFRLLLLANTVGALGTALLSPVLDSLIDPLGASAASIGYMMSAFTVASVFLIPVAGLIADRVGRKPLLMTGISVFGVAGFLIAFTSDFRTALLLRFVQGVGFAATTPIIITSIGDMYDGNREATAQGLRFSGSGVTQVVFPLVAGVLVGIAWQYPFALNLIAIPITILLYRWFDEPASDSSHDPSHGGTESYREQIASLVSLLSHRRIKAVIVVRGLPVTVWIAFLTYNSLIVVRILNGSPTQAGLLAALGSLSYGVAATQAGRVTVRFDSRLRPLVAGNLGLGGGFCGVLFAPNMYVAAAGLVLCGSGFGITLAIYRSVLTTVGPESTRGSLVGLAESFGRLMATLTPVFMATTISLATPVVGFERGLQFVGLVVAVLASAGGIAGLLVASTSPPVDAAD